MEEPLDISYGEFRESLPRSARLLLDTIFAAKKEIKKALIYVYSTGKNIYGKTERGFDAFIHKIIVEKLRTLGFEGDIISEEGKNIGSRNGEIIYVDPIDGSLNVVKGIPIFAFSMAYANGRTVDDIEAGLIWSITSNEYYLGVRGYGAYKLEGPGNVKIWRITAVRRDREATLIDVGLTTSPIIERVKDFGELRMIGSMAFVMARVAGGYLDAVFDVSGMLKMSDVAAGIPLLREAGARVEVVPIGKEDNPRVLLLASCDQDLFIKLKKVFEGEIQDFFPI